jgi:hypothetical protein
MPKDMNIKRSVFRAVNKGLSIVGMQLIRTLTDLDSYPLNPALQQGVFHDLALAAGDWFGSQTLFAAEPFNVEQAVRDFFFLYLKTPFRDTAGGSRFNNLLWLNLVARAYNPDVIIESGTYRGASAWALRLGARPATTVWSFDIDLSRLALRTDGVLYREHDWSNCDCGIKPGQRVLAYFDDHLDQVMRLLQANERGIDLAIFDDDFPVMSAVAMSHGGSAFPKIEFVLSDTLRREREVNWSAKGKQFSWAVDAAYLDQARAVIASSTRLPNTSMTTGLHQTPYRIVRLKH